MPSTICVFGLGHVGLPTAVVFAEVGYNVVGVDVDGVRVEMVNRGESYIAEPGLEELLRKVVSSGRLRATSDGVSVVSKCDAVLISVPTPVVNGEFDMSFLLSAVKTIARGLKRGALVVVESTVPPGTTAGVVKTTLEEISGMRAEVDFFLAHAPNRLSPGNALEDLRKIPRVIGGVGPKSTRRAMELYGAVNSSLYATDATTAELVKLVENTYRDLNIAFANAIALIAHEVGVDALEVIRLANTKPNTKILMFGTGVGGPCLPKDPYLLISKVRNQFVKALVVQARMINDYMPHHVVNMLDAIAVKEGVDIASANVVIFGVAYKGGVNDVRYSPALILVKELSKRVAKVTVYDPYVKHLPDVPMAKSLAEAVKDADILIIATDHPEFRDIDLKKLGLLMKRRIIIDGRRVIEKEKATEAGFKYYAVGMPIDLR